MAQLPPLSHWATRSQTVSVAPAPVASPTRAAEAVVAKLIHALESPRPKARYRIGLMTQGAAILKRVLPDAHTDFVYSVAGEEFGLVLLTLLTLLFAVIAIKGVMDAARHHDTYRRAAGVGLYSIFGLQAAVNMAVNLSLIPPKGMTLPLVSSGGSSLLGSALTLGLALALTRKQPESSLAHLRHA